MTKHNNSAAKDAALTKSEKGMLASCETIIERGITSFVEVGKALTQIRDGKLYRATHKTFDAYCQERWEIGRSRAYQLIDQAKVTAQLATAGVDLSSALDISQRDADALKDDPVAVGEIKAMVDDGQPAAQAVKAVVADKKVARDAEQQTHDAARDQARAALPETVRRAEEAKSRNGSPQAAVTGKPSSVEVEATIAERDELLEENAALKADIADRDRRLAMFDDMAVQFEKGGFEAVIATKDEQIKVLRRQVEDESADKATWAKRAEFWKKQALAHGYVPPDPQTAAGKGGDISEMVPF